MEIREKGYIIVSARGALGAIPLEGVAVDFYKDGIRVASSVTSENGFSEKISVDTPPRENSLTPSVPLPYALIDIRASKEGYYSAIYKNAAIFSGVTSVQPIDMIPLPIGNTGSDIIEYDEGGMRNL
ncbi:MAG: hypothetical protein IJF55_03125 [Clostridia bacterium]|nr:hypothetical protein [Clostridia bacterium]